MDQTTPNCGSPRPTGPTVGNRRVFHQAKPKQCSATKRHFADASGVLHSPEEGFEHASMLISSAAADLGTDWACDLFFAAEREYWTRREPGRPRPES